MSASWLRVFGLMIVSAWLAVGCSGPSGIDVGGTCVLNSDCNQGLVCTWGKCHDDCHTTADCPAGQSCVTASEQSKVCQLPVETHCIYASDCQPPLICAVDQKCRNQCQKDVDCLTGQLCTTSKTCAEPKQVDSNKNLFPPDGGFSGSGGASGADATASCPTGAETCSCYPNDTCNAGLTCASHLCVSFGAGGGAGGTANMGGSKATGGAVSTGGVTGTGGMGGAAGGTADGGGCPTGSETCSCYPNSTCNGGLICLSNLCVRALTGGAAGAGGTSSAGGTVNTGGATATGGMGPDASVGTARDSTVEPTSADAPRDVPVVDTSAGGGAGGAGGTTSAGGTTNAGGTTATGGISSTGGSTSSQRDAGVDSPAAADATTTPSQTVALFHFDGTQGSTVLTDSSGTGKVATITGNPVISTAQSKFGGAALYVNGNGNAQTNYVTISHDTDFVFAGDFTVDWWQNVAAYTDTWGGFLSVYSGNYLESGHVTMAWNTGGGGIHFAPPGGNTDFSTAPALNTWHHVALTREGQMFRAFIDGVLRYQYTDAAPLGGSLLRITGTAPNGDNGDFNGYIDELRVVKGVAVWTSDFTPPTAPYTASDLLPPDGGALDAPPPTTDATDASGQTVALFHFNWTDGGTVLTDSSGTGKVATITGNPIISTGQSKFGGASLYVNGNATVQTNYVRVPEDSDFNFPGDFTIDWWQYVVKYTNTWGGFVQVRSQAESDGNTCAYCAASGWSGGGSSYQGIRWPVDAVPAPTTGDWHHLALIRSGDLFLMFIDGKLVATDAGYSVTVHGILSITGQVVAGDNGDFNGYIDELRVVKGLAVWTSDFTPPTAEYQ